MMWTQWQEVFLQFSVPLFALCMKFCFVSVVPKFLNFTSFSKNILTIFLLSNHSAAQNGMWLVPTGFSTVLFLGQSVKGCTTGV